MHHYQNASIQEKQIECKKDKIHVSYKEINMVEQSSTVPSHHSIRIHKPFLGLEIINPGLETYLSESKNIKIIFLKLEF